MSPTRLTVMLAALVAASALSACGSDDAEEARGVDPDELVLLMEPGPIEEHWLGEPDAPVTVIEYASMTCSHCRDFHIGTFDAFVDEYVETGEVRFLFREFPLDDRAIAASMLARCAPGENAYYGVISLLFETQPDWAFVEPDMFTQTLLGQVEQAGFTAENFEACLSNQDLFEGILAVADRGAELGVNSTPTFFVNGIPYAGALSLENLGQAIDLAR